MTIHYFGGNTVNEVMLQAFDTLLSKGAKAVSRNGNAVYLNDVEIELYDPRKRHLCLEGRKSNIFQLIAETLWVMAGKDELHPYLTHFLPRAPNYSDDGLTWRGAYGPRLHAFDQLQGVVDTFLNDGMTTRRATAFIHDPAKDAPSVIQETLGGQTRDTPCNLLMLFYTDVDGRFVARTIQRSGDAIFGAGSINLFEFSFIQEMVLSCINSGLARRYPEYAPLDLGAYRHSTVNFHLYDATASQAVAVMESEQVTYKKSSGRDCVFPKTIAKCRDMAAEFIDKISIPMLAGVFGMREGVDRLDELFRKYDVAPKDNNLHSYMVLTLAYIASTNKVCPEKFDLTDYNNYGLAYDVYEAVQRSSFRKFTLHPGESVVDTSINRMSSWRSDEVKIVGSKLADLLRKKM